MPHLVLEYSENIVEKAPFKDLFKQLHTFLAEHLPTQVNACKSRALAYKDYWVGEGHEDAAYVHLTIKVLSGRPDERLQAISKQVHALLTTYFEESVNALKLQISVEIINLANTYVKS